VLGGVIQKERAARVKEPARHANDSVNGLTATITVAAVSATAEVQVDAWAVAVIDPPTVAMPTPPPAAAMGNLLCPGDLLSCARAFADLCVRRSPGAGAHSAATSP
jgi:hypothetical protein